MELTQRQIDYLFYTFLDPRSNAIMDMVNSRPDLRWDAEIEELEFIKEILKIFVDDENQNNDA